MRVLVTGSNGLIGSEAVRYYDREGHEVIGLDNNMRAEFFGPAGDTSWNLRNLKKSTRHFVHYDIDIRDRARLARLFKARPVDLIIHCAAQPSHDRARDIPLLDFEVNAVGTLNLLEMARRFSRDSTFIFMSTNKVYGDAPNEVPMLELGRRYDYANAADWSGINENCRIDRSLHSLFGASKLAADVAAQEYGRYFGMKVGVFRGGCLTGSSHSGVELHGFLSYLVKVALSGGGYKVFGYKGKQVRDNLHSHDVIQAFEAFRRNPRPGEVYNLGGGRENSVSVLEAIELIENICGRAINWSYVEANRMGDHICYISDMSKFTSHYPQWRVTRSLTDILTEIVESELRKKDEMEPSVLAK
jgi:CDP-paratose 2-epimerase